MSGFDPVPRVRPLTLIYASSANNAVGKDNGLPWPRLKEDMQRFRALTLGHPVIMGRKTFESIGKPLPGRINVVLSRLSRERRRLREAWEHERVIVAETLGDACWRAAVATNALPFLIGGAFLWKEALEKDMVRRIEHTRVHRPYDGDCFFQFLPRPDFSLTSETESVETLVDAQGETHPLMTFSTWDRTDAPALCAPGRAMGPIL